MIAAKIETAACVEMIVKKYLLLLVYNRTLLLLLCSLVTALFLVSIQSKLKLHAAKERYKAARKRHIKGIQHWKSELITMREFEDKFEHLSKQDIIGSDLEEGSLDVSASEI